MKEDGVVPDMGGGSTDELMPIVYAELRTLAERFVRGERADRAPAATSLVHQAYERLAGEALAEAAWQGKGHFFNAAARSMRRILVDRARAQAAHKRGGGARGMPLSAVADEMARGARAEGRVDALVLEVEGYLEELAEWQPRAADVVTFRFHAGLTIEQTAEALGVSDATVKREWRFARAWLMARLGSEETPVE